MTRDCLALGLALLLTACVPAPSGPATPVGSDATPGGTSLAFGCAGGELVANATLVEGDVDSWAVVFATEDGDELERIELPDAGEVSAAASTATAEACTPCTATLLAVTAGTDTPLLTVQTHTDADGDGYAAGACGGSDCADGDDAVNPDVDEVCDGVDNDCSGTPDDLPDAPLADDQDGVCAGARKVCDGNGGWVEPDYALVADYEATEVTCDGLDNDCSGQADDLDGAPDADEQRGVCLGAKKTCDGSGGWVEPDYTALANYEAAEAACDGLDNDCDGAEDNFATVPSADVQLGVCAGSVKVCNGNGWEEPDYTLIPTYEATEAACDGLDNDCDGSEDVFATTPTADNQRGVCAGSLKVCNGSGWQEPDYTQIANHEATESLCDGLDNDCDGDEDVVFGADPDASTMECWGDTALPFPILSATGAYAAVASDWNDISCALDTAGTLSCWGDNTYGALGDGTTDWHRTPTAVDEPGPWSSFDVGGSGVCAIKSADDSLWCWGEDGTTTTPTQVGTGTWREVSRGADHVCAIATDDSMSCWGATAYAQLGPDYTTDQVAPAPLGFGTWSTVSAGNRYTCGVQTNGEAWCWGLNWSSQTGDSSSTDPHLVAHPSGSLWDQISAADEVTCAIDENGATYCWGAGTLGDGNGFAESATPVAVTVGTAVAIDGRLGMHCIIDTSDLLWCWGVGGVTGDGDAESTMVTPAVIGTEPVSSIGVGRGHSCATSVDGDLWCWGESTNPGTGPYVMEVVVEATGPTRAVAAGRDHRCRVDDTDGSLWCWGDNEWGKIGVGGEDDVAAPTLVSAGPFRAVYAHEDHTCALDESDARWCWGANGTGQLGDSTTGGSRDVPWEDPDHTWEMLALHQQGGCGLTTDGHAWCWGQGYGPTPIELGTEVWTSIASSHNHACAIDGSGELWCWGDDTLGTLGDGTSGEVRTYADRAQVIEAGPWRQVSTNLIHTCAVKQDESLWCWGAGALGQLGDGQEAPIQPVPVQVTGAWSAVEVGLQHTCGLQRDGTAWCWGHNVFQQLGRDYVLGSSSTPLQMPGTDWAVLDASVRRTCGTRVIYAEYTCPSR